MIFFQYHLNFFNAGVFSVPCHFFPICFYRRPLHFLHETKSFASIGDSSGFSALCDISETFFENFRAFFLNGPYGFFLLPVRGKSSFRALSISFRVFFGTVILIKLQQWCSFLNLKNFYFLNPERGSD